MIYVYDKAIVADLVKSFNPDSVDNPVVKVIGPDEILGLAAQIKDDTITFPVVALERDPSMPIDKERINFTQVHRGVQSVIDPETNQLYYERAIPVKIKYKLHILSTSIADMDEINRELLFKYFEMYFLTITLPYESKRQVRFGITIDLDDDSNGDSRVTEYLSDGKLYQSSIPLKCDGCVLVSYTPAHLVRFKNETFALDRNSITE